MFNIAGKIWRGIKKNDVGLKSERKNSSLGISEPIVGGQSGRGCIEDKYDFQNSKKIYKKTFSTRQTQKKSDFPAYLLL